MKNRLGYTFYPKDWKSDDQVFELNLTERGLYRELIDLAMLSQNKVDFNPSLWQRLFNVDNTLLTLCLNRLFDLGLITLDKRSNVLSIPSVEKRIKNASKNKANGAKGGRPKKPKNNPNHNPKKTQTITQTERQREREREREIKQQKEKEKVVAVFFEKIDAWIKRLGERSEVLFRESFYRSYGLRKGTLQTLAENFKDHLTRQPPDFPDRYDFTEFKKHLDNWVRRKDQSGDLLKYKKNQTQKGDL